MSPQKSILPYAASILDAFANTEEVVVGLVDLDGRLLAGNAGLAFTAGRPLEALIGRTLWDALVRPEDEPMVRGVIAALKSGAPAMSAENPWRRADGSLKPMRWFNIPIRDDAGDVSGVLGFGHDAELHEALRARADEAEQRFHLLEAAIEEVFYISDLGAGKLLYASPGFERLWESPVNTLLSDVRLFLDRVHPDDRAAMHEALEQQLRGQRTEQEYRLLFPDGRTRWIRDRSYPVMDPSGAVHRVVGVASDVTTHRAAMERLADREQVLSTVFNRSSHALCLLSPEGVVLELNPAARETLGVQKGAGYLALAWASDTDHTILAGMLAAAKRGGQARQDVRLQGPHRELVFDLSVQPVPGPAGEVRYLLAEALDITQRLIDRRERDEAEQRLALAFEATSEGVWDFSLVDDSAFFSPRWCRNLGYRPDEVLPTPEFWSALIHPDEHDEVCRAVQELRDGKAEQLRLEVRLRMRNGGWFWSLTRGRVVERDAQGQPTRIVGTDTDIGQLKTVEARIRSLNETLEQRVLDRTEALAKANRAKDEFLAVMSHELRTPMMAILGVAESLTDAVYGPVNANQREALGLLETSGQHLLDLISDLLDLSKLDANRLQLHFTEVPVRDLVQDVTRLMTGLAARSGQKLDVVVTESAGSIEADPIRVRQVLVNLISNSIKFAPAGTTVSLTVCASDESVSFCVRDEGPGLPLDDIDRLFRPFEQLDMQLARKYGGLGLGLALVHRLTALHRGGVFVDSALGKGAFFQVTLPRSASVPPCTLRRTGRFMLVGDSDPTRARRTAWLEAIGFEVIAAGDVEEALARVPAFAPDILLIDSDANPLELLAHPTLRTLPVVVMMPVVTKAWREALHEAFGTHAVLETPCRPELILAAVDTVMAPTAAAPSPSP